MIPQDLIARSPLITESAARLLQRMLNDEDAPAWSYQCGDRLIASDLDEVTTFRRALYTQRSLWRKDTPPSWLLQRLSSLQPRVPIFRERFLADDFEAKWQHLPTTSREDLSHRLLDLIPDDEDVSRMVTHATSGTTGHPIIIPHHPVPGSCYLPLLDFVLERYGVSLSLHDELVGCFLLCAQKETITYATVHAAWANSGFAKINLLDETWPTAQSLRRYCEKFQPLVLSGDPLSFAEMLRQDLPLRPRAMISTAVAMSRALRSQLEARYLCPVIDWYSLNETGPVAYRCREDFFHILPHDLFVEILRSDGSTAPEGERGEVTLSGGRNPYLPMWRYRTGDFANLTREPCACGDALPRLLSFEGRPPVALYDSAGRLVNTVDVSRILRAFPVVQHSLTQHKDRSVSLRLRVSGELDTATLHQALRSLFLAVPVSLSIEPTLGDDSVGGKVVPYRSEC